MKLVFRIRSLAYVLSSCALLSQLGLPLTAAAQSSAGGAPVEQAPAPKLTKPPELVQFVEAVYPESERAAQRAAAVVLQLTITATGSVSDAKVTESAGPAFDEAALAAVKQFVFSPAEIDGKPAPIRILYRYEFVFRPEAPTTAIFVGKVRTRNTASPLAGVTVALDTGASAVTDAQGAFEIKDVPPGKHVVTLSGELLTALRTEETFEVGQKLDATYDVQPNDPNAAEEETDDLEIVVVAPPLRRQVVSTQVSAEEARKVPGTQGDVLRVVENLPGVARSAVGSGQLVVWGSAPEDTRVYVDGVRVPRLYHNGGLRSVISSELVESVDLVPGGYGAAFGRGLGGLVTVTTQSIESSRTKGSLALDVLDASGAVRVPVADKWSIALAARRSHLHDLLSGVSEDQGDIEEFFPIPRYYDGQARVRYTPSKKESVEVTGLLSSDSISRSAVFADPARASREERDVDFQRVYLSYRAQLDDGSVLSLTPFVGFDQSRLEDRVGSTPTELSNDTALGGVRASLRKKAIDWLTLEVGLDAELARSALARSGSIGAPPREGDVRVFGQQPPDQINADDWDVTELGVAPYVEGDLALAGDKLHVFPGLRVDPNVVTVSRTAPADADIPAQGLATQDLALEPRLSARYALTPALAVRAAWGIYHQPPQAEDLSATFGNPTLETSRAVHWVLGGSWNVTAALSLELTGFYATSNELSVRSPLASPLRAQALVQEGEGRAYGSQVLLRQQVGKRFFGWVSYSLVQSERRVSDDAKWRPFDYDQTHVITALASYDLGAGFEIGGRVRYATGFPRTEVIDAFYDSRRDLYQPVFGAHNRLRIPAFFEIDARISKNWKLGDTQLDAFLEVLNVTAQSNAEEIVYSSDYQKKKYITSLPVLPVAGVRWAF